MNTLAFGSGLLSSTWLTWWVFTQSVFFTGLSVASRVVIGMAAVLLVGMMLYGLFHNLVEDVEAQGKRNLIPESYIALGVTLAPVLIVLWKA